MIIEMFHFQFLLEWVDKARIGPEMFVNGVQTHKKSDVFLVLNLFYRCGPLKEYPSFPWNNP